MSGILCSEPRDNALDQSQESGVASPRNQRLLRNPDPRNRRSISPDRVLRVLDLNLTPNQPPRDVGCLGAYFTDTRRHGFFGHYADTVLTIGTEDTKKPAISLRKRACLVAGRGFEPLTFRL